MITRDEADRVRDELLQVLTEDAHNTERLLRRLDALTQETGIGAYSALMMILTQLAFDEADARAHWEALLAHRHELSLLLGRDVGVRVAVVDYFMNVNRKLVQPTLIDLELYESREHSVGTDSLTGLVDDRSFRAALQTELRRAKRYGQEVAVALFDLDDFGELNENLGKLVCDRMLRETAILLNNKIRDIDVAGRPGEDEFALALPETGRNGATLVAERFRRELDAYFARREAAGRPVALTVSAGVACYPADASDMETLLAHAAQALYHAKAGGKNAIHLYHPERRRFLRFDLTPGRYEVEVLSQVGRSAGAPRNLSRNGIVFTCPERLEVGEEIEIRLIDSGAAGQLPPLRVRGRVVRLEELPEDDSDHAAAGGDRFEVGVAFDLDWDRNETDLLQLLERSQSGFEPEGA